MPRKRPDRRPGVIFMAPTPPPFMGPSVATEVILGSRFMEAFEVHHIDTADRRPLSTLGALDPVNFYMALKHYVQLLYALIFRRAGAVYMLVTQTPIGFLRDAPMILMAWAFRKRVILHLRGGYFGEFYAQSGPLMRWIVRATLGRIDRMIVLGERLRPMFHGLVARDGICVVPNGLDLDPGGLMPIGRYAGRRVVLYLSNLIESKGYRDALQAAPDVIRRHPEAMFVFAGAWMSPREEREGLAFVEQEGLGGHVEFAGPVKGGEKLSLLKSASMLVFPTYYDMEGHPWVIVEAMAAGLPVISTDHAAIGESVEDGVNGYLVAKRSPGAVAVAINRLLDDRALLERMGRRSRRIYEGRFTGRAMTEGLIACIEGALRG